jgi:hypothetical protein
LQVRIVAPTGKLISLTKHTPEGQIALVIAAFYDGEVPVDIVI